MNTEIKKSKDKLMISEKTIDNLSSIKSILVKYNSKESDIKDSLDQDKIDKAIRLIDSLIQTEKKETDSSKISRMIVDVMNLINSLFL